MTHHSCDILALRRHRPRQPPTGLFDRHSRTVMADCCGNHRPRTLPHFTRHHRQRNHRCPASHSVYDPKQSVIRVLLFFSCGHHTNDSRIVLVRHQYVQWRSVHQSRHSCNLAIICRCSQSTSKISKHYDSGHDRYVPPLRSTHEARADQ